MPKGGMAKSKRSLQWCGSGNCRRKQASGTGKGPSGVSGRLRSSSTNGSDRDGGGKVPVESRSRRLQGLDDPVAAGASLETIPETGAPSASSSLIDDTSIKGSPPHPSRPAEGIGGLPTSITEDTNASRSPGAAREGVPRDIVVM